MGLIMIGHIYVTGPENFEDGLQAWGVLINITSTKIIGFGGVVLLAPSDSNKVPAEQRTAVNEKMIPIGIVINQNDPNLPSDIAFNLLSGALGDYIGVALHSTTNPNPILINDLIVWSRNFLPQTQWKTFEDTLKEQS